METLYVYFAICMYMMDFRFLTEFSLSCIEESNFVLQVHPIMSKYMYLWEHLHAHGPDNQNLRFA